jgi:sugar-specific transcriptional regulator TrmB
LDARALVEELKHLGLTSYEAKCYVSLVRLGPTDPRTVAADASIPYPSAYEALNSLARKDWSEVVTKKPAAFRARKPSSVKADVDRRIEETFKELEGMYKVEPVREAELVYTIRGRERVLAKVYELIGEAKESVIMVAPTMALEDSRLLEVLDDALARGVAVRAVGDEGATSVLPPGTQIRTGALVAVDLLVDNKAALVSLPDYSACGWIDSLAVAGHFRQFLELLWSVSTPS